MQIGGLDIGTTGCKLTVYNAMGEFVCNEYKEYNVSRVNGEHEIDAEVIFDSVCSVIKKVVRQCPRLEAIGVTTFGETFVMLDKEDKVLLPSMLYTDPRGEEQIQVLKDRLSEERLIYISGVKPNQMYSLPKIMWIKDNLPEVYEKTEHILLMEDFLIYKLTGKACIDYSLAARTMAFDIRKKCWSKEIFEAAEIDEGKMSETVPTGSVAGNIKPELCDMLGTLPDLKIVNGAHDQVAAAVGAGVFKVGQAVDGTGTVECVTPVFDKIPENKALYEEGYSVVPYVFDGTYVCYALSFTGGAVLKWYRDNFAKYEMKAAEETGENVYAKLDGAILDSPTDILILPHFAGAANPYMDNASRAVIAGLTLEHTGSDIYKALMEGVTYEIMTNIEHLKGFGIELEELFATGGGASSEVWLRIKADILNRRVTTLSAQEVGACGTCMLTCVAVGACADLEDAKRIFVKEEKNYEPNSENVSIYKKNYERYRKLYDAVRPLV